MGLFDPTQIGDDNFIPSTAYWGGVILLGGWLALLWLVSRISGWSELAAKYAVNERDLEEREQIDWHGWQFGYFHGWCGYKGCLWVGLAPEGLYLKTGPDIIFRFCHPPLCIPWEKIQVGEATRHFWRRMSVLRIADPKIKLLLPEGLMQNARLYLTRETAA